MPGSNRSVVAEAKDLKPFSVRLLRCTGLRTGRRQYLSNCWTCRVTAGREHLSGLGKSCSGH
jgi:hypothetical protein